MENPKAQKSPGKVMHPVRRAGLLILLFGLALLFLSVPVDAENGRVVRIIDGDTITVRISREIRTVRLIGVDTPETKHPTKEVQYFGREASAFTSAALKGKTVRLETDSESAHVDRYGRWLRYVYLDGDNFNARLIREGYAYAYRLFPFSKRPEFVRLEEQARRQRVGLWNRR